MRRFLFAILAAGAAGLAPPLHGADALQVYAERDDAPIRPLLDRYERERERRGPVTTSRSRPGSSSSAGPRGSSAWTT